MGTNNTGQKRRPLTPEQRHRRALQRARKRRIRRIKQIILLIILGLILFGLIFGIRSLLKGSKKRNSSRRGKSRIPGKRGKEGKACQGDHLYCR